MKLKAQGSKLKGKNQMNVISALNLSRSRHNPISTDIPKLKFSPEGDKS
jgi:hypothetical protein